MIGGQWYFFNFKGRWGENIFISCMLTYCHTNFTSTSTPQRRQAFHRWRRGQDLPYPRPPRRLRRPNCPHDVWPRPRPHRWNPRQTGGHRRVQGRFGDGGV